MSVDTSLLQKLFMKNLFLAQGLLNACNRADAKYLFQKDKKLYDISLDTGDKTIQCGRPNDIYKLWLMWRAKVTLILQFLHSSLVYAVVFGYKSLITYISRRFCNNSNNIGAYAQFDICKLWQWFIGLSFNCTVALKYLI